MNQQQAVAALALISDLYLQIQNLNNALAEAQRQIQELQPPTETPLR